MFVSALQQSEPVVYVHIFSLCPHRALSPLCFTVGFHSYINLNCHFFTTKASPLVADIASDLAISYFFLFLSSEYSLPVARYSETSLRGWDKEKRPPPKEGDPLSLP